MNLFKKTMFMLLLVLAGGSIAFSQKSEGGIPQSFAYKNELRSSSLPEYVRIGFNVDQLKKEDIENQSSGSPLRIGMKIPVEFDTDHSGEWILLPNGQEIWRLSIEAKGALAITLFYDKFYIPEGGKLFIYNQDKTQVLGAYTHETNSYGEEFATELVAGDIITLEYERPIIPELPSEFTKTVKRRDTTGDPNHEQIVISGVGYGYNHIRIQKQPSLRVGESCSTQVNINCEEGENWINQKKGVGKTTFTQGSSIVLCSGSLVNNTAQDMTPYWLSAAHCYGGISQATFSQMIFYFHYEAPSCANISTEPTTTKTMVGATPLVQIPIEGGSDGALLRLNQMIPEDYDVYYNGWDRSNIAATSGVGIHHPANDLKKIATYITPARDVRWSSESALGAHWCVNYVQTPNGHSAAEGGSSGSPLFNQNGLIVGALSGGDAKCGNPGGDNLYGKLWYHWNQAGEDPSRRMDHYLDPVGSEIMALEGIYHLSGNPIANFTSNKTEIYAMEQVKFTNLSSGADTYEWSFPGGAPSSSTEKNPPLVTYYNAGKYDVSLIINKGTDKETQKVAHAYISAKVKTNNCPEGVTVGSATGAQPSQFPLGAEQHQTFSSTIYTSAEINGSGYITQIAWYTNKDLPLNRTLKVYMKEVDETTQNAAAWSNEITGATLVYTSSGTWKSVTGWNAVTLDAPFIYSGTKSLKVMVQATTEGTSGYSSASVLYNVKANTHQQWISATTDLPAGTGTVNGNRPVTGFTIDRCPPQQPVAKFTVIEELALKEGFDEEDVFPPSGWDIKKPGVSSKAWSQLNLKDGLFNEIDPYSSFSAVVEYDESNVVDTWLVTPSLYIQPNTVAEFYANYGGSFYANAPLSFSISADKGTTWEELWTNDPAVTGLSNVPYGWYKQTIHIPITYVEKNVLLRWRYYGINGESIALDGIKISAPTYFSGKATIKESESIQFTDYSTGPAVTWEWSFPGGTPSTSNAQHPLITYMEKGTYDVTLKVKNTIGENEKTFSGAVTVTGDTPKLNFSYTGGYIRQENHGIYIPTGGRVLYTDQSENVPTQWEWELGGGDPSSSNYKKVETTYNVAGKYPLGLKVSNTSGQASFRDEKFISVGYEPDSIWNMPRGDKGVGFSWNFAYGYLTGANNNYDVIAEYFEAPEAPISLTEVKMLFVFPPNVTSFGKLQINVHSQRKDSYGEPGPVFYSMDIDIADLLPKGNGYHTFKFPQPIGISDAFFISVSGLKMKGSDGVSKAGGFGITSSGIREDGNSTAVLYYNGYWYTYGTYPATQPISLNIVPHITYVNLEMNSPLKYNKNNIDTNTETVSFSSNLAWKATSNVSWIKIQNGVGNAGSNCAFSYSCSESKEKYRTGTITLNAGGITKTITVCQAGPNVENLTATVKENTQWTTLKWETPKAYVIDPENAEYFDDAEDHYAFNINSRGPIGWSYIDGDDQYTWGLGATNFPGEYEKMAFIVLNPKQMTPAVSFPQILAHSGDQYFGCFAPNVDGQASTNNDWMISPELGYKESFSISFYAKTYDPGKKLERMRVVYSTTGKAQGDFTHEVSPGNYVEVPGDWTNFRYTVPPEAKYVAINCVSTSGFFFQLDDIYIGKNPPPAQIKQPEILKNPEISQDIFSKSVKERIKEIPSQANVQFLPEPVASKQLKSSSEESEVVLRFDNGVINGGTGYYGLEFGAATQWLPADLENYKNYEIRSVYIGLTSAPTSCVLKIWQNDEMIYSQPLSTYKLMELTKVDLTSPVLIDIKKPLKVGYTISYPNDAAPAGLDAGPIKTGRNFFLLGNDWYANELLGINYNWNIAMSIAPGIPDVSYNIYRDEVLLTSGITDTIYTDGSIPVIGNYCYSVSSVFRNGAESIQTDKACITVANVSMDLGKADQLSLYPNPVVNSLNIDSKSDPIIGITVTDITGRMIQKIKPAGSQTSIVIPTDNWSNGSYLITIQSSEGQRTYKVVKN